MGTDNILLSIPSGRVGGEGGCGSNTLVSHAAETGLSSGRVEQLGPSATLHLG